MLSLSNYLNKTRNLFLKKFNFYRNYCKLLLRFPNKTDRSLLKLLLRVFDNHSEIIEAGSNSGHLSFYLALIGFKVTLLDILSEPLKIAKSRFDKKGMEARFICSDLRYIDEKWDGVWNTGVVQYYSPNERISLIESICKMGNTVLLVYPKVSHHNFPKSYDNQLPPGIQNCIQYDVTNITTIFANSFNEVHFGQIDVSQLNTDYPFEYIWAKNPR